MRRSTRRTAPRKCSTSTGSRVRIGAWLTDAALRKRVADAGLATVDQLGGALRRTLAAIEPYLMQLDLERR